MKPRGKRFKIRETDIKDLIEDMGGCFATDRILVDGAKVGYMYREEPEKEELSGWVFMAGDEPQEYADDPDNWGIYSVNTICNYDPAIIPYLDADEGMALGRVEGTDEFEEEEFDDEE